MSVKSILNSSRMVKFIAGFAITAGVAGLSVPTPAAAVQPAAAPTIGATPAPPSAAVQPANPTQAPVVIGTLAPPPVTAPATSAPIAFI